MSNAQMKLVRWRYWNQRAGGGEKEINGIFKFSEGGVAGFWTTDYGILVADNITDFYSFASGKDNKREDDHLYFEQDGKWVSFKELRSQGSEIALALPEEDEVGALRREVKKLQKKIEAVRLLLNDEVSD